MKAIARLWSKTVGRSQGSEMVQEPGSTIPRPLPKGRPAQPVPTAAPTETRAGDRFVPRRTSTALTIAGGKKLDARIINMSSQAVAVEADLSKVGADSVTFVGSQPVTLGRIIPLGAVFIFAKPIDPKLCSTDLVL